MRRYSANRRFMNGIFWIPRTGAPCRALPRLMGNGGRYRFRRWRDKRIWEKFLEALTGDPNFEWPMIDASHSMVHLYAAGINAVIPSKKNRKEHRNYDRYLCKIRRLVESVFLWRKRWRGIATRYAKTQHRSWPLFRFAVLSSGLLYCLDLA